MNTHCMNIQHMKIICSPTIIKVIMYSSFAIDGFIFMCFCKKYVHIFHTFLYYHVVL